MNAGLKLLAWPGGAALHVDGPLAAGDWAAGGRGPRTLGPGGELQPRHDRQAVHHDHRSVGTLTHRFASQQLFIDLSGFWMYSNI